MVLCCVLGTACDTGPLRTDGKVVLWAGSEDPELRDTAAGLGGLILENADASRSWSVLLSKSRGTAQPQNVDSAAPDVSGAVIPDLIATDWNAELVSAGKQGIVLDLSRYWDRLSTSKSLLTAFEPLTKAADGRRIFLPASAYAWLLFYNKEVLSQNGIGQSANIDELERNFALLKSKGTTPLALGSAFGWPALALLSQIDIALNGPEAYLALTRGERSFDNPDMLPVYERLALWRDKGWVSADAAAKNWPDALTDIESGSAAFAFLGSFAQTRLDKQNTIAFAAFPANQSEAIVLLSLVQGFAVPADARNPEAALALADVYVSGGARGHVGDGYRVEVIVQTAPSEEAEKSGSDSVEKPGSKGEKTESSIQTFQKELLKNAVAVPQLDRALPAQRVYDINAVMTRFFAPKSAMSAAELSAALTAAAGR